jgi:hypothetical protein
VSPSSSSSCSFNLLFFSIVCFCFRLQGDLEQLTIVPNPSAVGQQCSATRIPLLDPALLQAVGGARDRRGRRTKGRKGVDYHHNEPAAPWKLTNELSDVVGSASPRHDASTSEQKDPGSSSDEEDLYEGSGAEGSALGEGQYGEGHTGRVRTAQCNAYLSTTNRALCCVSPCLFSLFFSVKFPW